MSSNKRLCLRSDTQKRQSFCERICDDLSELILQNLSLEDKLRFQCVSKHFQRIICVSQRLLVIDFDTNDKQWLKKFEYLLKTFPFISKIELKKIFKTKHDFNAAIDLIIKYCHHLKHFNCGNNHMNETNQKKFIEKFGSKLISVNLSLNLLKLLLSSNTDFAVEDLVVKDLIPVLSVIHFKRLRSVDFQFMPACRLDQLELFIDRNPSIRYLKLDCYLMTGTEEFRRLLDIISKLKNLVHLDMNRCKHKLNDRSFAESLAQMAVNCKQLRSIEYRHWLDIQRIGELLSPLRQFKGLKRLRLDLVYISSTELVANNQLFTFRALVGFEDLTHLTIHFPDFLTNICGPMAETMFTNIDLNLPKLQSLVIYGLKFNGNQWMANILSRLSKLETIQLHITDEAIRSEIDTKLRAECKRIRKIVLNVLDT